MSLFRISIFGFRIFDRKPGFSVKHYIADLRAATQMERDIYIFRMNRLRIPQERLAARLGLDQKTIYYHLGKKAELPFSLNTELRRGFTVPKWLISMPASPALLNRPPR